MRAHVVIGANMGDEGKGKCVDALCHGRNALNVRFNGSCGASHTVVTPEGHRHVFHMFGAGSLAGAPTLLAQRCVINPMRFFFLEEAEALQDLGCHQRFMVDERCRVTTPYDMMLNHAAERMRGDGRHGSTGVGLHETVVRTKAGYGTTVAALRKVASPVAWLRLIRDHWVPRRLTELGIPHNDDTVHNTIFKGDEIIDAFMDDWVYFLQRVEVMPHHHLIDELALFDDVVLEGAQGLLLDEQAQFFPHVTCSRTGLPNVMEFLAEFEAFDKASVDVYYMTRAYLTRHGAGPLPGEDVTMKFEDDTNVTNEWQGALRFAPLDWSLMVEAIHKDAAPYMTRPRFNPMIVMTHTDQVNRKIPTVSYEMDADDFMGLLCVQAGIPILEFPGKTRERFPAILRDE